MFFLVFTKKYNFRTVIREFFQFSGQKQCCSCPDFSIQYQKPYPESFFFSTMTNQSIWQYVVEMDIREARM